jgi:ABC-type polysaccharide/polyol phosphate export permease
MAESGAAPSEPARSRVLDAEWVHRTAHGIEIGVEVPTGKVSGSVDAFLGAVKLGWSLRQTLWVLVVKDFKGRYRAQALGLFWSFAHPLVMMTTMTVAFQIVLKVKIPHFPVFYLIGSIFWQFFTNVLLATTGSMTENAGLVKRTTFPRFLFPIATTFSHLIHFGMEMGLVFAFFFVFPDAYHFNITLLALPLLVVLLLVILIGIGLMTSTLHVKYRDLYYMVTSLITVGFWGTPVLFSTAMAPGWIRPLLRLNPLAGAIEGARDIIMNGQWPKAEYLVPAAVIGVILFFVGCAVFRRQDLEMADYV